MQNGCCGSKRFLSACAKFPTGVTVATVLGLDGLPYGITLNSFTSVSLEPPAVLVCIDQRSEMVKHLSVGKCCGINILGEEQSDLSVRFARNWRDRFSELPWYAGETGVPLLFGVAAALECRISSIVPAGDHIVVIAYVSTVLVTESAPLIYLGRSYYKIHPNTIPVERV